MSGQKISKAGTATPRTTVGACGSIVKAGNPRKAHALDTLSNEMDYPDG